MITIIKSLINFSELAAGQMSRLLLLLHLVSFWAPGSMSLKVFSFEKSLEESSGPLSVATLDSKTSEDLPPRFIRDKRRNKNSTLIFPDLCCAGLTSRAPGTNGVSSTCTESTTSPGSQSGTLVVD